MSNYEEFSREELEEALNEFEEKYGELKQKNEDLEFEKKKAQADFQNYKKREDKRKERWQKQAQESLAEDLIEVMDNLERALASADEDSALVKGVKMVADQLYQTLQKKGLERIDAEGEEFDPKYHKAVETREREEHNQVLEQKRKGYRFDDKVLREAEVIVGKQDSDNE